MKKGKERVGGKKPEPLEKVAKNGEGKSKVFYSKRALRNLEG